MNFKSTGGFNLTEVVYLTQIYPQHQVDTEQHPELLLEIYSVLLGQSAGRELDIYTTGAVYSRNPHQMIYICVLLILVL